VERQHLLNSVLFGTFRDPFVNGAKHFLVVCHSLREVHAEAFSRDLPQKTK